jgi:hypothetical protein
MAQLRAAGLGGGTAARGARGFGTKIERGIAHKLTAARIAELHRWQMLGAGARRGVRKARTEIHHARASAYHGHHTIASIAHAAVWGVTKTIAPQSLVTPVVPGYQPGDRLHMPLAGRPRH